MSTVWQVITDDIHYLQQQIAAQGTLVGSNSTTISSVTSSRAITVNRAAQTITNNEYQLTITLVSPVSMVNTIIVMQADSAELNRIASPYELQTLHVTTAVDSQYFRTNTFTQLYTTETETLDAWNSVLTAISELIVLLDYTDDMDASVNYNLSSNTSNRTITLVRQDQTRIEHERRTIGAVTNVAHMDNKVFVLQRTALSLSETSNRLVRVATGQDLVNVPADTPGSDGLYRAASFDEIQSLDTDIELLWSNLNTAISILVTELDDGDILDTEEDYLVP